MWDLTTIIRKNNEAQRAFEKNSLAKGKQEKTKRNEAIYDPAREVFVESTYLRGLHESKLNRCTPQGQKREESQ